MIGETVGSYKILSKLSVGGMGTVYRAEHTLIGKLAAVKILHPELSGNCEIVNRFFNEAKATTTIKHPGIVEIFDFGYMASGHAYLTMEFLEGMSLARHLKTKGRMAEGEAAMMLRAVCSALAAAHAKGIVHRDLKPDNIFMVTDADSPTGDRPKVLDFGIAKLTDLGLAGTATKTGAVMGTPTYMSPEQCKGTGDVDHRADLYSIGCIFYELLVGRPPFTKLGAGELIGAHIYAQPDPPSKYNPAITKESEKLIMSLLQKRPEKRPQTARELAQRLAQLAQNLGWTTVTSPDGAARSLRAQSSGPVLLPPSFEDRFAETVLPPQASASDLTTPYGLESNHDALEKPTTLSGAASQSVASIHELPKKRSSRKGLVIGLMSAMVIGAAAFAAIKVTSTDGKVDAAPAATQPQTPTPARPPEPKAPEPKPPEPVATKPAEPVAKPAEAKTVDPVVIPVKPRPQPRKPVVVKPPEKPVAKPPPPDKPPEKKCKGSVMDCPLGDDLSTPNKK